jgi:Xaa-Pro aminopeptidase
MDQTQAHAIRNLLQKLKLNGVIVSGLPNVRYLSGYTGSDATLWLSARARLLFTDSRYTTQARAEAPDFQVIEYRRKAEEIGQALKKRGVQRAGFESGRLTHALYREYRKHLRGVKLTPLRQELERLRAKKSDSELQKIQRAGEIAGRALTRVLPMLKPGAREREVALELELLMKRLGAEQVPFPAIVASGRRGALPHGVASNKKLKAGELVTLDFGCSYRGYNSDQTLTLCLGEPSAKQKRIYEVVRQAQARAIAAIRPGASLRAVDARARDYIREQGFGEYFGHGLGHGVGLEVHEEPYLNSQAKGRLEAGMVVTVEPGIYLPGWGGVRIEDMVAVTAAGARVLTQSSGPLRVCAI